MSLIRPLFFLLSIFFGLSSNVWADFRLNMRPGVTPISQNIYDLHMTIFWICVTIGLSVFCVMFYSIIYHRKSRHPVPAHFHESTLVEILWTIVPFILLILMAIPASLVLIKMDDTKNFDLTVKITGYQWHWEYEYFDSGLKIVSNLATPSEQIHNLDIKNPHYLREVDNPLVLPVNKKIRFITTSNDVIHSWWVPKLGVKKDAIPGYINETWATIHTIGTYRGQCAELCGVNHGFMPIVVEVKSFEDYQAWVKQALEKQKVS